MPDSKRDAPVYNIKAVAHLTGIAADTLRRWESRYGVMQPQRTAGGYRKYSARDVETILWLKSRIAEGLSISRACELLAQQGLESPPPAAGPPPSPPGARPMGVLVPELLAAFRDADEPGANQVINEALALYGVEATVTGLIEPSLFEVGERWLRGEISVAQEHFASTVVRSRLANLFHSSPYHAQGPLILVACAPGELHEIGAQSLAVFLRRAGYRVVYLGQNVPQESLIGMVRALRPALVCCSASRPQTAAGLSGLAAALAALHGELGYLPAVAFGGSVFNRHPALAERLGATTLGTNAAAAVEQVAHLLGSPQSPFRPLDRAAPA